MDIKAYYLIRQDINMSTAKLAVQIGHGTDFIHLVGSCNNVLYYEKWLSNNRKKILLKIDTLEKLFNIEHLLKESNIEYALIYDNGLTEFGEKTLTGLVIYPTSPEQIPKQVKRLRLL